MLFTMNTLKNLKLPTKQPPAVRLHQVDMPSVPKPSFWLNYYELSKIFGTPIEGLVAHFKNYGAIFGIKVGKYNFHWCNDAEVFHKVTVTNADNYTKKPFYDNLHALLGAGLINAEGKPWRAHRRMVQPAFSPKQIALYKKTIYNNMDRHISQWQEQSLTCEDFDITTKAREAVLENLLLTILSPKAKLNKQLPAIEDSIVKIQEHLSKDLSFAIPALKYLPNKNRRAYDQALEDLNKSIDQIIQIAKDTASDDLADEAQQKGLLSTVKTSAYEDRGYKLGDEEVAAQIKTMLLAGYESTAASIGFILQHLAMHQEHQETVFQEIERVMGEGQFDLDKIKELTFTKAVISETLRLYPPIWVLNRSAIEDDELLGYKFPKKSMIVLSIYHMHRNPKYWNRPNDFVPQRFIDNDYTNVPHYAPFSHGKRQCIGKEFVLMELLLMTAMTIQRYQLKQNKKGPIKFRALITLRPDGCPSLMIQRR